MEILKYLFVIDILVAVSLVFALIWGLVHKTSTNLRHLIAILIPVILFFCLLNPISNKIVNKEITAEDYRSAISKLPESLRETLDDESLEGTYSVKSLVNDIVVNKIYKGDESMKDSKTAELAEKLSAAIVKVVVYITFLIFLILIFYLLVFILWLIHIIFLRGLGNLKIMKKRASLINLLCSVVRFTVIFILLYLPIFGVLSVADEVSQDMLEYKEELSLDANTVKTIDTFGENYNKLLVKKIIIKPASKIFSKDKNVSIDIQYVTNGLAMETENGKVNLFTEYSSIKKALPVVFKIMKMTKTGNGVVKLNEFSAEEIEAAANIFKDSNLLKAVLPVVSELVVYNLKQEHPEYVKYFNKLTAIDWNKEMNNLGDVILVIKNHLDVEVDTNNINSILVSDNFINLAQDLLTAILKMQIIKDIAVPLGIDFGVQKLEENFKDSGYDIDFESLKELDWVASINSIIDYAFDVYKEYVDLDLDTKDLNSILNNIKLPDAVKRVLDGLADQTLIVDHILPPLMQIATAKIKENDLFKDMDINYDVIKNMNWHNEIPHISSSIQSIIKSYQNLGIDPNEFNFESLLKNPKLPDELNNVTDKILDSDLVSEFVLPIAMAKLLDIVENIEGIKDFNIDFAKLRSYDYSSEIGKLKDVFVEVVKAYQGLNFDKDNWDLILDDANLENYINNIVDKAMLSSIIKDDILPKLANKLQVLLDGYTGNYDVTVLKDLLTEDSIVKLLNNDVHNLIDIIKNLKSLGIIKGDGSAIDYTNTDTQNAIANVIKDIFKLSIVDGKQEQTFDGLLNMLKVKDNLTDFGVTIDYTKVTDWEIEIDNLTELFVSIMKFSGNLSDLDFSTMLADDLENDKKELLSDIVVNFAESQAMGDSIYNIMNKLLANYDEEYQVTFTDLDKFAIENETGWKKEMDTILNVLKKTKEIEGTTDYADYDVALITDVINEASEGVIASKIVGKVLTTTFGSLTDYDFTNRNNLKNSIPVITQAINLANVASNENALDDINNISQATDAIRNLANADDQELVNDFLNEILSESGEVYTKEQMNESADLIDNVYAAYDASSDKENFSLSDLPADTQNDIEANPLAKKLLLLWFEE